MKKWYLLLPPRTYRSAGTKNRRREEWSEAGKEKGGRRFAPAGKLKEENGKLKEEYKKTLRNIRRVYFQNGEDDAT